MNTHTNTRQICNTLHSNRLCTSRALEPLRTRALPRAMSNACLGIYGHTTAGRYLGFRAAQTTIPDAPIVFLTTDPHQVRIRQRNVLVWGWMPSDLGHQSTTCRVFPGIYGSNYHQVLGMHADCYFFEFEESQLTV